MKKPRKASKREEKRTTHHYLAFNFLKAPKRPNLEIQQVLKNGNEGYFSACRLVSARFVFFVSKERFSLPNDS